MRHTVYPLIAVLAISLSGCGKQAIETRSWDQPVATSPTNAIRIGDLYRVTVDVPHLSGTRVELPVIDRRPEVIVRSQTEHQLESRADRAITRFDLVLTSLVPSNHVISTDFIRILGPGTQVVSQSFPFIRMDVISSLSATNTGLRDYKPLREWKTSNPWFWIAALALLLTGLAAYILRTRRISVPLPAEASLPPPHVEAMESLRALREKPYIDRGEAEAFFVELTTIVRRYVERRFGLHAPERTTDEFMQEALSSRRLSSDQQQRLGSFLQFSDLVKFARQSASSDDMRSALHSAEQFVIETAPTAPSPEQPS